MQELYRTLADSECLIVIFDLSEPDGEAALRRQRHALAGYTSTERLDESCVALIVRPGWLLGSPR